MKIALKVFEITNDLVTLIDEKDKLVKLPIGYFNHQPALDEIVNLHVNDTDNQAKNILNEIFNQNSL